MSLIADALKAAERERHRDDAPTAPRRLVAQTGFFATPEAPGARFGAPSWLRLGLIAAVATATIGTGALYVARRVSDRAAGSELDRRAAASRGGISAPAAAAVTDSLAFAQAGTSGPTRDAPAAPASAAPAEGEAPGQPANRPGPRELAAAEPRPLDAVTQQGAIADTARSVRAAPAPLAAVPAPAPPPPAGGLRIAIEGGGSSSARTTAREALEAQRRRDFFRARDLYRQAIDAGAGTAAIYNNLGAVLRQTGDLTGAVASYRRAIELDPSLVEAWLNLGASLAEQSQGDAAAAAFQRALALDPRNAAAHVRLAQQYRALGSRDDARRLLEEAITLAPDHAEAHYVLGQILEEQGEHRAAAREFDEFLRVARGFEPAFLEQVRSHSAWLGAR